MHRVERRFREQQLLLEVADGLLQQLLTVLGFDEPGAHVGQLVLCCRSELGMVLVELDQPLVGRRHHRSALS